MKKTANKGFPWKVVVPVAVVLLLVVWFVGMFNGLISAQESVDSAWSNVESVYQRRADLIPNLVETVKG
ncbi:LemA family protein, partial [Candidatus Woesearchaeota archaeon]